MGEPYPSEVETFKVVGRLVRGVADTSDADQDPELVPVSGVEVTFTPNLNPPVFRIPSAAIPTTVFHESVIATTDAQGYLKLAADLSRGVVLPYGFSDAIEPRNWTWGVKISVGGNFPDRIFNIAGGPGAVIDLANLVPVPESPGGEIIGWQSIVAQVTAAREIVLEARDAVVELTQDGGYLSPGVIAQNIATEVDLTVDDADIPGQVISAVASATTVTAAAAAAVTAEIAGRELVEGDSGVQDGLLVAVTDELGYPTWLQARTEDGGPTEFTRSVISGIAEDVVDEINPISREILDVDDVFVSIVDELGNRTWLEARTEDGGPTDSAMKYIKDRLDATPPADIIAYGDSITAGGHGTGATWESILSTLIERNVVNRGISGQTADPIAIRLGVPQLLTFPGGEIPASGLVTVTNDNDGPFEGSGQPNRTFTGTVRGVPVTLGYNTTTAAWTVTRTSAGTAVPVASPVAFIPTGPDLLPNKIFIIWAGRNNNPKSTALDVIDSMVAQLPTDTPFLVLSITNKSDNTENSGTSAYTDIVSTNLLLLKKYPRQYVDMRGRLIREGLGFAGLTATSGDLLDISQDTIPSSLMYDGLHPNGDGRVAIAHILKDELAIRSLI